MLVKNGTSGTVQYEIRGGPFMMILTPGELGPGVTDNWENGYGNISEVEVSFYTEGGFRWKAWADADATVAFVADGKSFKIDIEE